MGRVILTNYLNSHLNLRYSGHTAFKLVKRGCIFRLRRKTIPQHCTTILKTSFKIVCFRFWKCEISIITSKIVFSIKIFNFYKFFSKTWSGLLIKNFVHQNALQPMTSCIERGPLQILQYICRVDIKSCSCYNSRRSILEHL